MVRRMSKWNRGPLLSLSRGAGREQHTPEGHSFPSPAERGRVGEGVSREAPPHPSQRQNAVATRVRFSFTCTRRFSSASARSFSP